MGAEPRADRGCDGAVVAESMRPRAGWRTGTAGLSIVHGDLAHGNVLDGTQLWLLDWEYAQRADPLYDVACALAYYPQARPLGGRSLLAAAGLTGRSSSPERLAAAIRVYDGAERAVASGPRQSAAAVSPSVGLFAARSLASAPADRQTSAPRFSPGVVHARVACYRSRRRRAGDQCPVGYQPDGAAARHGRRRDAPSAAACARARPARCTSTRPGWRGCRPPMSDETDMLKDLTSYRANSRLSCQIPLTDALDGLRVTIAPEE